MAATVNSITATVLVENTVSRAGMKAEHGLAVFIQTPSGTVLWDTGQSPLFLENACRLGLDPSSIGHVAFSHGHYDHTGGLDALLQVNPGVHVHGHPDMFMPRYSRSAQDNTSIHAVGSPVVREYVETSCGRLTLERDMSRVLPGVYLTGEIPRVTPYEDTGGDFFVDLACTREDTIPDDQALFIDTPRGIVVFLGCAHAGVVNTLDHIARLTGKQEICAVYGGMHLHRASTDRLEQTARKLEEYNVRIIGPCHCTGGRAQAFLRTRFPNRYGECETGSNLGITS